MTVTGWGVVPIHTDIDWIWSNLGIGSDKPSLVSPGHGTAAFGESDYQIAFQVGGARSLWEFVGLSMGWVSRRFLGIFPRKHHKLVGKREESCRMMHPDSYSSCHTPPAQELSFFENRASQEKIVTCRFQEHWSGKQTLDSSTLLFFFRLKLCDLRTQNGGLPGADEVAVCERDIAPMKGETLQCWTQEFQPVSTGFNQNWSVWFLLKETFILGCPFSQVYRDPLLLLVLTKNNNPGGDWNPRQGYDNPTFIIFWCFLKFVEPLKLSFCREDLQQEIDLAVLTLLSYLSHLGEDCWNRHEMLYICDSSHGYVFTEYIIYI